MFDRIGRIAVGCLALYLGMALLSALTLAAGIGEISGLDFLGILGLIAYANRGRLRRFFSGGGTFGLSGGRASPALPPIVSGWNEPPAHAQIQALVRRFIADGPALASSLPEDPLDRSDLVDLWSLYLYEPPAERQALQDEYQSLRRRLVAWRAEVQGLQEQVSAATPDDASRVLPEARRLETELNALQQAASGLGARARDAAQAGERALTAAAEATVDVQGAEAAYERVAAMVSVPDMAQQLARVKALLVEVQIAGRDDAPRPLTALRLSDVVGRLAREIRERADRLAAPCSNGAADGRVRDEKRTGPARTLGGESTGRSTRAHARTLLLARPLRCWCDR